VTPGRDIRHGPGKHRTGYGRAHDAEAGELTALRGRVRSAARNHGHGSTARSLRAHTPREEFACLRSPLGLDQIVERRAVSGLSSAVAHFVAFSRTNWDRLAFPWLGMTASAGSRNRNTQ